MYFSDFRCDICGCSEGKKIDFSFFFFPTVSHWPGLHEYDNFICKTCGVVFVYPQMTDEKLIDFYNTIYRESPYAFHIENKLIDTPIKIPGSGVSLQRFKTFYKTLTKNAKKNQELIPEEDDVFIDYGAYQGIFLHGVSSAWGCKCIAYDYNEKGIEFAKKHFGFTESVIANDIYKDVFGKRAKYISLIHVFEHLRYPHDFLRHIKDNVIEENGFLYIEVPNIYAYNLGEPSHFYSYSKNTLSKCLRLNGFHILDIYTTGYPPPHTPWLGHSELASIICLCKPAVDNQLVKIPKCDADVIYKGIKKIWRRLSRIAVQKQLRIAITEICRLLYYSAIVIFERISDRFSRNFERVIRQLIKKPK